MLPTSLEDKNSSRHPTELAVRLSGLATAVPPVAYSQEEILHSIVRNTTIREKSRALYRKLFAHPSITSRHFALTDLEQAFDPDLDGLNRRFEKEATRLASQALKSALQAAELRPIDLDYLVVTTCTGYVCPGIAAHVVEELDLNPRLHYIDLVGMGCGGALPALEQAANYVRANPGSNAAVVCVEICSAAFFSSDDPDVIVSNALFSDGAAAAILSSHTKASGENSGDLAFRHFESLVIPAWREELRFRSESGRLRNVLGIDVPKHAGESMKNVATSLLRANGLALGDIHHWVLHPGGETVLRELTAALGLSEHSLEHSRSVLRNHGNMSSASVLFVLDELMKKGKPVAGDWGVIGAFGAGFSAFAALVRF
jgi:predicted naringenin-chalcone synthase